MLSIVKIIFPYIDFVCIFCNYDNNHKYPIKKEIHLNQIQIFQFKN